MKQKSQEVAVLQQQGEKYTVSGVLNFATVSQLYLTGEQLFNHFEKIEIDFSNAILNDSSALALLIEWTKMARVQKKKIYFSHLPQQLIAIAKLSNLNKILPIV